MSVEGLTYCVLTTVLKFLLCRQFIHSKIQTKNETDENFIHREMHIAFVTALIFMKHLLCHRLLSGDDMPLTMGGAILGGILEAVIMFVVCIIIYSVLKWLYIRREDDEGRAVMSYYLTIPYMALREIAPGLAIVLSEI